MAWWRMACGDADAAQRETLRADLEHYCALDTLAMVEIYRRLAALL